MSSRTLRYQALGGEEETDKNHQASSSVLVRASQTFRLISWRRIYDIVLHAVLLTLFGFISFTPKKQIVGNNGLLASELAFAQEALQYESVTFHPSGFTDDPEPPTPYEGPPSAESNKRWSELFDVGMYVLSKEQYEQLGVETAELVDQPDRYLITIEVFHQLHCLDYIRIASYAGMDGILTHHEHESTWSKKKHLSHCIDYLRQVLTCHGDLTPITLERVPGHPPYKPNFRIQHSCRNFERIRDFATRGNTSGYGIA